MELTDIPIVVRTLADALSCFAIVMGGLWVYWKYIKRREDVWNLKMKITSQVFPCCENTRLLKLCVTLCNIGNVIITPGANGCQATVTKLNVETCENNVVDLDAGKKSLKKKTSWRDINTKL